MDRNRLSEMRQRLNRLLKERAACEAAALGRGEMVRAAFLERQMPPSGNTGCYLSASIEGQSRHRYVPKAEVEVWRKRSERWSEFYRSMARWRKLNSEIEQLMRAMGRARCVPLPPKKGRARKRRATHASKRKR